MRRIGSWMTLSLLALAPLGCGWQAPAATTSNASAHGGLAVIDLDAVAKSVGRDSQMNQALKIRENALNQGLSKLQNTIREQIDQKKAEIGEEPTDEQRTELAKMQIELGNRLAGTRRQAQASLEQYRQQLVAQFRIEVRPVAQQIAQEKGLSVVIPRNEGLLLSVDPGCDITTEVAHAMQTAPKPAAKPVPTEPQPAAPKTAAKPMPEESATK